MSKFNFFILRLVNKTLLVGIISIIFLVPLIFDTRFYSFKLLFFQVMVSVLVFLLGIKILIDGFKIKKSYLILPVIFYLIVIIYSYFISDYKQISQLVLLKHITFISFFFILISSLNRKNIDKVIFFWLFSTFLVSVYGILQFFNIDFLKIYQTGDNLRVSSTLRNPNFLAGYLTASLPIAFSKFFSSKTIINKISVGVLVLSVIICLVFTFSRSGYIASFASLCVFFIILFRITDKKINFKKIILFFLIAVIFFSLVGYFYQSSVNYDFIYRPTARLYIWQGAYNMILENPFIGYGLGLFPVYFPRFRSEEIFNFHFPNQEYVKHAHNHLLEIWIESGIMGLVILIVIWYVFLFSLYKFIKFKKNDKESRLTAIGIFSCLTAIILMSLVNVDIFYTTISMVFWFLLALIIILSSNKKIKEDTMKVKNVYSKTVLSLSLILFSFVLLGCGVRPFCTRVKSDALLDKEFFLVNNKVNNDFVVLKEKVAQEDASLKDLYSLGTIYAKRREWDKAAEYLNKYIEKAGKEKDVTYIKALNNLGNIYIYTGDLDKAIELYQEAIHLDPKYVNSHFNIAMALFQKGEIEETVVQLEKVLKLEPRNYDAKNILNSLGE